MQEPRVALDPRAELEAAKAKAEAAKMGGSLARFFLGLVMVLPLRALVASYFWLWFVVPVVPGAPVLTVAQSYGVLLVFSLFLTVAPRFNGKDERGEGDKWFFFLMAIPGYLSIWGIGWLFLRLVYL